jgi:hypothetical protein
VSCRTRHRTAAYTSASATAYLASSEQHPLLVHGITSEAVGEAVLGRYTTLEAGLAIKNPPKKDYPKKKPPKKTHKKTTKKSTKNVFFRFFKFLIFYENNTNFSL